MKASTATPKDAREQIRTIAKIAARACTLAAAHGVKYEHIDAMMDVEAAHAVCALDLDALLAADDGNFRHDVFGIRRHLNRQTKQIEDCFLPRFARREAA